jgi:hypothetical protein
MTLYYSHPPPPAFPIFFFLKFSPICQNSDLLPEPVYMHIIFSVVRRHVICYMVPTFRMKFLLSFTDY